MRYFFLCFGVSDNVWGKKLGMVFVRDATLTIVTLTVNRVREKMKPNKSSFRRLRRALQRMEMGRTRTGIPVSGANAVLLGGSC